MTQECRQCHQSKPFDEFYKNKRNRSGIDVYCKTCAKANVAAWAAANPKRANENKRRWKLKNKEYTKQYSRAYEEANREHRNAQIRQRRLNNLEQHRAAARERVKSYKAVRTANENLRRARQTNATPKWLTAEDRWLMQEAYKLAKLRELVVGGQWQVDHVVPLRGKVVSGLHVPWNLQVISAESNRRKSNVHAV